MQSSNPSHAYKSFLLPASLIVSLGLLLGSGAPFAADGGSQADLARRLQAVEDRVEIQQLITSDYSTAVDTQDWKTFGSLFTEDADFRLLATQFPPKEYKGRAAIEKSFSGPPPPGAVPAGSPLMQMPASMKHVITNPHIQLEGDSARATTYWMEVSIEKDGKVEVRSTGYYRDMLKRDQGRWRFKKRDVFNYDMARVAGAAIPAPARTSAP